MMASAFDDDKHTGPSSSVFDDLDRQHNVKPLQTTDRGGVRSAVGSIGSTADDIVRAAADSATFGLLDRGLEYTGLEPGAIAKTKQARERSPYATIGGDIAGSVGTVMATPLRAIGAGLAAAAGGAKAGLGGIAGRAAGYGAEGALFGGAQAAGHTYDWKDLPSNVGLGAGIGAAGGAITGPFSPAAAFARRPNAAVPTRAELNAAENQMYDVVRQNPGNVFYSGPATQQTFRDLKNQVYQGFDETSAPITFSGLSRPERATKAAQAQGGNPVFSPWDIEMARRNIGNVFESGTPSDIKAGTIARRGIDAFTDSPPTGAIVSGTPQAAQITNEALQTARGNAGARIRSDIITNKEKAVDLQTASQHSGLNYENNMRRAMARVLAGEGKSFSEAERAKLEGLAKRTDLWNQVRTAGNMLGCGVGIGSWIAPGLGVGAGVGVGAYTQDPLGTAATIAAPIVAGRALRGMSNRSMNRAVGEMDELVRMRSPEFERRQLLNPGTTMGPGMGAPALGTRNAVIESILRREQEQQR